MLKMAVSDRKSVLCIGMEIVALHTGHLPVFPTLSSFATKRCPWGQWTVIVMVNLLPGMTEQVIWNSKSHGENWKSQVETTTVMIQTKRKHFAAQNESCRITRRRLECNKTSNSFQFNTIVADFRAGKKWNDASNQCGGTQGDQEKASNKIFEQQSFNSIYSILQYFICKIQSRRIKKWKFFQIWKNKFYFLFAQSIHCTFCVYFVFCYWVSCCTGQLRSCRIHLLC